MDEFNIGDSLQNGLSRLFDYLPQLIGAVIILIIGYFVAKVVGGLVRKALQKARFDRALHNSVAGNYISRLLESPSKFAGKLVYWLIFLFFISMAANALQLPLLNMILAGVYAYIPKVIIAIIIFLVASAIAAGTAKFVQRVMGKTAMAKMISTIVPVITLSIATFMILNQLDIAKDIVNILFTAIVGSIALGMALAFGLGGRDVAKELLQQAYQSGKDNVGQAKAEARQAADNTRAEAARVRRAAQ